MSIKITVPYNRYKLSFLVCCLVTSNVQTSCTSLNQSVGVLIFVPCKAETYSRSTNQKAYMYHCMLLKARIGLKHSSF